MHQLHGDSPARTHTPVDNAMLLLPEASEPEEDNMRAVFAEMFRKSEAKLDAIFTDDGSYNLPAIEALKRAPPSPPLLPPATTDHAPIQEPPRKKARVIDEDDYGDDDDDDDNDDDDDDNDGGGGGDDEDRSLNIVLERKGVNANAVAAKSLLSPSKSGSSPVHSVSSPGKHGDKAKGDPSQSQAKSSEDARKALEEVRNATEEAAKRSFHTLFHTLENDRTAMLEQAQLEESEKQLQAEMDKTNNNPTNTGSGHHHSSLSNANLGASSLTLKHLIARIDSKRDRVQASDAELRSLMNEVRKNRSKWASEDNVGQEELYEALEKVLSELKAHTEYSTPFLNRVNKRDAPDYYTCETASSCVREASVTDSTI